MYEVRELNERLVSAYQNIFGFDKMYAKLLAAKNFTGSDIVKLLDPERAIIDPMLLTSGYQAVERIKDFITNNQNSTIWIFADYDTDGMTSAYIMHYALTTLAIEQNINCHIQVHLPDRADGYGITKTWVDALKCDNPTMVITVDNGTNAIEAINALNERNIPVIVTDHHMPEAKVANCLIVNPNCYDEDPHKHLAGCGVAFKLGMLLVGFEVMKNVIDLLAVGTIGDMMPMTSENIAFCQMGLKRINDDECHYGIRLLKSSETITYKDIAFEIVPKLNCCGRMGCMQLGKDFMFAPNPDNYEIINNLNEERKTLTKKYVKMAQEQNSCVVVLEECGAGIAGIIAGQLSQSLEANIIVLVGEEDRLVGSARAFNGSILSQINSLSDKYQTLFASGHDEACGVSIDKQEVVAFTKEFNALQVSLAADSTTEQSEAHYLVDFELDFNEINNDTLEIIRSLPYDKKHLVEPVVVITANLDKKEPTKSNPDNIWLHLSANHTKKKLKIWAQGMTAKANQLKFKKDLKFIATVERDFMNPKYTTLKIIDIME